MFFKFSVHLVHFKFIAFAKQDTKQDAWKFYDSLCKRPNWSLSVFTLKMLLGLCKYPYMISNKGYQTKRTMENFQITAIDTKGLPLSSLYANEISPAHIM